MATGRIERFGLVLTCSFELAVISGVSIIVREEGVDQQAVDEIKQHFGIVAEGLESKIEIIAEGHALLRAEMKTGIGELKTDVGELRSEIGGLRSEVGELKSDFGSSRTEVKQGFSDVRSMIKLSYAEIDTRIGNLEHDLADLRARVESVEAAVR